MPTYTIQAPDGKTYDIEGPAGATADQLGAFLMSQQGVPTQQAFAQPERSVAQRVGDSIMDIPRQVGLTARYGMEGVGQAANVLTEPLRQLVVNPIARLAGLPEASSTSDLAAYAADSAGLPQPKNADERVVGDITRTMAGAGTVAGGAQNLARGATGAVESALNTLGSNVGSQVASAAGAGGAGGAVREAGGGPLAQTAAGVLGGIAVPASITALQGAARRVASVLPGAQPDVMKAVSDALDQAGVDVSTIPPRVMNALADEATSAVRTGQPISKDAIARLAAFKQVPGVTPTRGMLSQDPVQVTREMNLAKEQANTGVMGPNLAQIQNQNNAALVDALNRAGAAQAKSPIDAGETLVDALRRYDAPTKASVDNAYQSVRDAQGRYAPMDVPTFSKAANDALDEGQLGFVLPAQARNWLNDVSSGKIPLDVNVAQQADKMLGGMAADLRRQGNNQGALAVSKVRDALSDTPILTESGKEAQQAYEAARAMAAERFGTIKDTPALAAALGDSDPSKFVQNFIVGSGSKTAQASHVQALADALRGNAPAFETARNSILGYLKDKALSGQPDDIGAAKFSASQFAKALRSIGDEKLMAFFEPPELGQLHAIGQVGRLMVNQPVGSAVNNSNTSSAMLGGALRLSGRLGNGIALLGIGDQLKSIGNALGNRSARQIAPSLMLPPSAPPNRLIPASVYGSMLAGMPSGQNNGGN